MLDLYNNIIECDSAVKLACGQKEASNSECIYVCVCMNMKNDATEIE